MLPRPNNCCWRAATSRSARATIREAAQGLAALYHRGYGSLARDEQLAAFWTIQSRVDTAFAMGPAVAALPHLERVRGIDPFALQVE
jgi:hypothetical protein